ncbi:MAG: hypothetical protein WD027_07425 [Gaiellales bacterium]
MAPRRGSRRVYRRPSVLIETIDAADESKIGTIYRDLALYAEGAHDLNNDRHVKPLTDWFRAAILLLMAEISAWVIDLGLR